MDVDTLKDIMKDSLKTAEEIARTHWTYTGFTRDTVIALAVPIFEARVRASVVPEKVFVITRMWSASESEPLLYAHRSLNSAQMVVNGRTGRENHWSKHDSHGVVWITMDGAYAIHQLEVAGVSRVPGPDMNERDAMKDGRGAQVCL